MFVSPAYAQTAAAPGGFDIISLLPLVMIFVVFYFLLIRPQQKKVQTQRDMIQSLKRGDKVLTAGGIIAEIVKVEEPNTLIVEIAPNVRVKVARSTITEQLTERPAPSSNDNKSVAPAAGGVQGVLSRLFKK